MDSQNRMWIGTGEGLVCFPSSQSWDYKVYRSEEGLSNVHIRAITEDNHGNIWVSTNKGISCLLKDKEVFYNYDHWDNVPMGNFMSGSVAEAKDGTLYFGSINGLCRFNPDQVLEKRESPAAIITEMRIFGPLRDTDSNEKVMALEGQSEVRLSYMQNNFSVTFNIQNYALADQVEYAYMLKGLENSWYTVTDPNNVTFRNIPPGNYCFQVKTRIRNQEWADEIASLDIRIDPPVWLTWWAKLFYILSGVSVLYFILHAYEKKLDMESLYELEKKNHEQEQELNNERLRFYTNITHELRTPLTLILGPLEDMQKSNSLSGKDSQKISVIHQSAIRLLNLINQILEFRKTETQNKKLCVSRDNLAALVHEIGLKYKELNRKPEIDFCLEIEQEDMSLFFDKEVVTIILDNLISNAIKYTEKGTIIDKRAAVTESMNKLDNEFLEKINKLIEDRLSSEKIDIGYLSDAMCMSNSTLYRKMKALTGLSTNEYIRKIKMQYAERLLLEGKYNISEVAFKVGINSTVYFRQCFKDEFGMAPSDYLKKIKPE